MTKRIHVGNLGTDTTERELTRLFEQAGRVVAARIIRDRDSGRSKGFGFVEMKTGQVGDHTSRHLTDGTIDLALIKYDSEESAEARASGLGPCIHHFAIEVDDMAKSAADPKKFGCEIISDPGVIPIKFRAPGGTVAEIVPTARYKKPEAKA